MQAHRFVVGGLLVLGAVGALAAGFSMIALEDARREDLAWLAALVVPLLALGGFAWIKRPGHPMARVLAVTGSLWALTTGFDHLAAGIYEQSGATSGLWLPLFLGQFTAIAALIATAWLFGVFPDGRARRGYERLVLRSLLVFAAAPVLSLLADPTLTSEIRDSFDVPNPVAIGAVESLAGFVSIMGDAVGIVLVIGLVVLVLRYRRAPDEQRRQIRWLLVVPIAGMALTELDAVLSLADAGEPVETFRFIAGYALLAMIPGALAIAIFRHRLLDIDVLLRGSLVFAVLWLAIALAYVGAAAALGIAAGDRLPVEAAVLLAILAAVSFQPARQRLERLADRLVFGERVSRFERSSKLAAELQRRIEEIEAQTTELAASRARIVQAQDAERRRIEQNIHDGAQQSIVALMARLRLARNQLDRDPEHAAANLAELQDEAARILGELRELARGIHPSVLSDRGLFEAVQAAGSRLPLPVRVVANPRAREARYADDIEGAAYFVVTESLANVLKHARATRADVSIAHANGALEVAVEDDGVGINPQTPRGSGLANLRDRVEALGGRVRTETREEGGTRLVAELPARGRNGQ
jgi:signal transduction histidine kinase